MRSWEHGSNFRAAIESDPEITAIVPKTVIAENFCVSRYLQHVNQIFLRVFPRPDSSLDSGT